MTLFWPAPDVPPPTYRWPPGTDLEEEYYAKPSTRGTLAALGVKGPGVAEIKPHNEGGIRGGHRQLAGRSGAGAKVLITYRPREEDMDRRSMWPSTVDVYAITLLPGAATPTRYRDSADWCSVGSFTPPQTVKVTLRNPSVFGAIVEAPVRRLFLDKLIAADPRRSRVGRGKSAHATGVDVAWSEIAELYAELGRDLHDEFLAELASELAVPDTAFYGAGLTLSLIHI